PPGDAGRPRGRRPQPRRGPSPRPGRADRWRRSPPPRKALPRESPASTTWAGRYGRAATVRTRRCTVVTEARVRRARARLGHALSARGLLVCLPEPQVVLGDLLGGALALQRVVEERLQRVPPDRAPDREAHVAVHGRARPQPLVDLVGRRAAAEHHATHAAAPAGAGLGHDALALTAVVHALDLPDVDLDVRLLEGGDGADHQPGAELGVEAVAVAADGLELRVRGRHE